MASMSAACGSVGQGQAAERCKEGGRGCGGKKTPAHPKLQGTFMVCSCVHVHVCTLGPERRNPLSLSLLQNSAARRPAPICLTPNSQGALRCLSAIRQPGNALHVAAKHVTNSLHVLRRVHASAKVVKRCRKKSTSMFRSASITYSNLSVLSRPTPNPGDKACVSQNQTRYTGRHSVIPEAQLQGRTAPATNSRVFRCAPSSLCLFCHAGASVFDGVALSPC